MSDALHTSGPFFIPEEERVARNADANFRRGLLISLAICLPAWAAFVWWLS